jgi:MHS family proline/betaine transporter-like MFS transporter
MRSKNKYFYAAIIGNILEYYDVALYGLLFPKLAVLFFPHEDPTISMLWGLGFLLQDLSCALWGVPFSGISAIGLAVERF